MLEATGERLIPGLQRDELVYAEHVARYRLAAELARGRRVLDAGSGEGYGTAMLAAAGASHVVGVDIAPTAVGHARKGYGLEFVEASIEALPLGDSSFDLVVCFETVEHVQDPERALAELARVLSTDGTLVISTPNSDEYLVENEFHNREFAPREFDKLLAAHFPARVRLYQQNWLLSAILDERQFKAEDPAEPLGLEVCKAVGLEPGRELYSVVLCGTAEVNVRQVAVVTGIHEAHRLNAEVRACERQREAWEERATIAERQREAWEERASEAERQVGETREQLTRAEDALQKLASSVSWRITKPLRSARGLVSRRG